MILIGTIYEYRIDVKKPVKNIIITKIVNKPPTNDIRSSLERDFRLTLTKIGNIGNIHGDNIDITPEVKEIRGRTSI